MKKTGFPIDQHRFFKHIRKNRGLIRRRPFSGPPARLAMRLALLAILTLHSISCGGRSDSSQQQGGQPGNTYSPYELLCLPASTGPLVAAHRGAHNFVPENSLAAIREAARLGADFAEIDVRSTQDGVLVLCTTATCIGQPDSVLKSVRQPTRRFRN